MLGQTKKIIGGFAKYKQAGYEATVLRNSL